MQGSKLPGDLPHLWQGAALHHGWQVVGLEGAAASIARCDEVRDGLCSLVNGLTLQSTGEPPALYKEAN